MVVSRWPCTTVTVSLRLCNVFLFPRLCSTCNGGQSYVIFLLSLVYIPSVVEAEAMPPVMFCLVPCIPSICDGGGTYCSSERDQL